MRKAIKWIILGVVALLVIAVTVYFFHYGKDETIALFERVKDFVNQPLPIIGVSTLVIGAFILKAISMTAFGNSQVNRLKAEHEAYKETAEQRNRELEERLKGFGESYASEKELNDAKMETQKERLDKVIAYIKSLPNKKAKELIKELEASYEQADE